MSTKTNFRPTRIVEGVPVRLLTFTVDERTLAALEEGMRAHAERTSSPRVTMREYLQTLVLRDAAVARAEKELADG